MTDCVFCKIIKDELPSHKVYEDDKILAFLDIQPINKGHVLIVSKEHYVDSLQAPDELLAEIVLVAKKIAQAQKKALGAQGINFGVNNGAAAGQIIFHIHWHLIPRYDNDGLKLWPGKEYKTEEEKKEIANKIVSVL